MGHQRRGSILGNGSGESIEFVVAAAFYVLFE